MMMRILSVLKSKLFKEHLNAPLCRWKVEKCNIKINNKIDLSNEDHCGPCGQYIINKNIETNKIILSDEKK
jgi:hypothetical protein